MYRDTVQDTHLTHRVPLQLSEQHNNPWYTSLPIFSAGLCGSLTLLLYLVISLCITTSALCHPFPTAKSAPPQLCFKLLHEICFLQRSQVKPSFCSPVLETSAENQTVIQPSQLLLVWSALEVGFSVNGVEKKEIDQFTRLRLLSGIYYETPLA